MQQPICGQCRRGVRTCSKESDHIILGDTNVGIVRRRTRYDLSFNEDQTWIGLPPGMHQEGSLARVLPRLTHVFLASKSIKTFTEGFS
jgi:hypothetical protein